jgi:hypothetical protein
MFKHINMSREKIQFEADGPIMPGSISVVMSRCNNRECVCYQDASKMHGPYYRWTGVISGRRTTKNISKEVAKECERRIRNYRKLQQQVERAITKSFRSAPWDEPDES